MMEEISHKRITDKEELKHANDACNRIKEELLCISKEEKFELGDALEASDWTIEEHKNDNVDLRQKLRKAIKITKDKLMNLEIVEEENEDLREKLKDAEKELNVLKRKCVKDHGKGAVK